MDPNAFPTFEISGGYQLLHVPDQTFPFGLNVDGAWNPTGSLGLVGEIGFALDSEDEDNVDVDTTVWNLGVGPRWNFRSTSRVLPFAQVLVGAAHARGSTEIAGQEFSDSATRFMLQPGVGVYYNAGDGWGVVGSVDYRRVFLDEDEDGESGENEFRVFLGIRLLLD
jgi:opacity protein-like surface antigen